jgi:ribonuclease HII
MVLDYYLSNDEDIKKEVIVGIDECACGVMAGDMFIGAVIWHPDENGKLKGMDNPLMEKIKDSKKMTKNLKKREELRKFIEENCNSFKIYRVSHQIVDELNILQARLYGYKKILDEIYDTYKFDRIIIDGTYCNPYYLDNGYQIVHTCIEGGDNKYVQIAAASMLAKIYHDIYIRELVDKYPELKEYDIHNNVGYGTKKHLEALKNKGYTQFHRKSYGIIKELVNQKKYNHLIINE